MQQIKNVIKKLPGLKQVVLELNSLRVQLHSLNQQNQKVTQDLQAKEIECEKLRMLLEELKTSAYKQKVKTPSQESLKLKCFEYDQIPGRKTTRI